MYAFFSQVSPPSISFHCIILHTGLHACPHSPTLWASVAPPPSLSLPSSFTRLLRSIRRPGVPLKKVSFLSLPSCALSPSGTSAARPPLALSLSSSHLQAVPFGLLSLRPCLRVPVFPLVCISSCPIVLSPFFHKAFPECRSESCCCVCFVSLCHNFTQAKPFPSFPPFPTFRILRSESDSPFLPSLSLSLIPVSVG